MKFLLAAADMAREISCATCATCKVSRFFPPTVNIYWILVILFNGRYFILPVPNSVSGTCLCNILWHKWPRLFDLEKYGSSPLVKSPARSYWLILIVLQNLPNLFQLLWLTHMRVAGYLRENQSTISSLVLLLGLISRFPTNEVRVATIAPKCLRIDYDSFSMSKNALGILYKSRTIFRIGEFVAKVLNSSKLLSLISR